MSGMPARRRHSIYHPRLALALLLVGAVIVATGVVIGRHFSPHASAPGPTPSPTRTGVVSPGTPSASPPTNSSSNELTSLGAAFPQLQSQPPAANGHAGSGG